MSMRNRMVDQPYEVDVKCKACGKIYHQRIEEQIPGFKLMDEDVCPYCKNVNGKSMCKEYTNSKLEE